VTIHTAQRTPKVLVLDTGIAPTAGVAPIAERSFVGSTHQASAADDVGHGTAVYEIIDHLVPAADLIVYEVADANGRANQWDTLCALGASTDVDVINISLTFGLADRKCPLSAGSNRLRLGQPVFEYFLEQIDARAEPPLLVAAVARSCQPRQAICATQRWYEHHRDG